jgi:hypothetical protein
MSNTSNTLRTTRWIVVLLSLVAAAAAAAPPEGEVVSMIDAGALGRAATAPDGSNAERVDLAPDLAARLLELSVDGSVLLTGWPIAAEERGSVELTRFDVYAPDARIVEVRGDRLVEVPRSRLAFFRGIVAEDPLGRVLISVDPEGGRIAGVSNLRGELHELRALGKDPTRGYLVAPADSFIASGEKPDWSCAQETGELDKILLPSTAPGVVGEAITSLHTATVAVDTDNELLLQKFNNSTAAATSYIANLFAAMTAIYERDLLVRLLQGFTILRPSTTADPYAQTGSPANGNLLGEFGNYWSGGCGGACNVQRALAMMLSGKSSSNFSASGIAWVNSLCSGSTGYSFNEVFKFAQDTSGNDILVTAHELGHNFGSPHTHCYNPPIDQCYNAEGGCYSGTRVCPAPATYNGVTNVTGTLMSYCHLSGLGGCGSSAVFHPTSVNLLAPLIQARVNQCIFPLGPPTAVFSNGFETGLVPPWSGKRP